MARCSTSTFLPWLCAVILFNRIIIQQPQTNAVAVSIPREIYDASGTSQFCVFREDTENKTATLHGRSSIMCRFEVLTSNVSATEIQITDVASQNYLLFVKNLPESISTNCQYDFAVIDGRGKPCGLVLFQENLQFNVKGNVSILLREVFLQHPVVDKCFETDVLYPSKGNQTLPNCHVSNYHDAVVCDTLDSANCTFDFPQHCNSTLGYREVNFSCSAQYAHRKVLIIYPSPMYALDAAANNIVEIDTNAFQSMNDLQELLLQYNYLLTLNHGMFKDLNHLVSLYLQGNALVTIHSGSFQGLDMLAILDLSYNVIDVLPDGLFQNLTNLEELNLQDNHIGFLKAASFHGLESLKILKLQSNLLTTLDAGLFQGLISLQELDIEDNRLNGLDVGLFGGLINLTKLDLHINHLVTLDVELFHGLNSLVELDLENNRFTTLNVGLFHGLNRLKTLDLDRNSFTILDLGLFEGLKSLIELDLDFNRLSAVEIGLFHGLGSLEELDLDYNQLATLDVGLFHGLNNLIFLDLDNNQLTVLEFGLFKDLRSMAMLWLAQNQLVTLDVNLFTGLDNLTDVFLHNNNLMSLEAGLFHGVTNLAQLALSGNQLVTISADLLKGLYNLVALHLNENRLGALPSGVFLGLTNLEALYLDNNNLGYLEEGVFKDLVNLDTLTLQSNKLTFVDFDLLRNTLKLSILDLSENMLQAIPDTAHLLHLNLVIISNNELLRMDRHPLLGLVKGVHLIVSQHEICECYVPENATCSASLDRSPYITCDRLLSDNVLMIMMWVIGLNAVFGNAFVLCWRNKQSSKNKVQSLLLSHLAMSDLLMGVYMIMIAIADIHFGEGFPMAAEIWRTSPMCKFAGALSIVSSEASVFFITIISLDRLISIKYYHSAYKFGTKSTIVIVAGVWIFSSALGVVPSILAGKYSNFYDNSHVCVGLPLALTETFSINITQKEVASIKFSSHTIDISKAVSQGQKPGMYFSTAVFLGINCFCYFLIACCYVMIIQTVRKSSKRAALTHEMKKQLRLTAKITAIVATDFLCWSPIIVLGILVQCQVLTLPPSIFAWSVTFVLPINSAINPYLYTMADVISSRRKRKENDITSLQQDPNQQPHREAASRAGAMAEQILQSRTVSLVQQHEGNALPNVVI